jgi:outer membrane usher protein
VLTQLFPYTRNRITINEKDAPIDVTLNSREQTVAPYYRSGTVIDFGARRTQSALVQVRLRDGMPLPSAAEVRRVGEEKTTYPVGDSGEVYLSDVGAGGTFIASWGSGQCRFAVDATKVPREVMPRVGPLECVKEP